MYLSSYMPCLAIEISVDVEKGGWRKGKGLSIQRSNEKKKPVMFQLISSNGLTDLKNRLVS